MESSSALYCRSAEGPPLSSLFLPAKVGLAELSGPFQCAHPENLYKRILFERTFRNKQNNNLEQHCWRVTNV